MYWWLLKMSFQKIIDELKAKETKSLEELLNILVKLLKYSKVKKEILENVRAQNKTETNSTNIKSFSSDKILINIYEIIDHCIQLYDFINTFNPMSLEYCPVFWSNIEDAHELTLFIIK